MAKYLTMRIYQQLTRALAITRSCQPRLMLVIGLAGLIVTNLLQAETLNDPTQAPASLYSAADGSAAEEVKGPVLQSVMIGPHYRAAIINGEKVMLGKKYSQSTLIKLNEREAVLRNADMSTQTLILNKIIVKKTITSTAARADVKKSVQSKSSAKIQELSENR